MNARQYDAAVKVFESFEDTTTILAALATWLDENDDRTGAQLVIDFRSEFAEYEHQE